MRFVRICDLISSVSGTRKKMRVLMVADMKLLMKHVGRTAVSSCVWDHDIIK